jgi:AcrR family transcriptional regulator
MVSTKRDETRGRLLDVARHLLVERGYHGVTIEQIAKAAGVSRQAVYAYHFGSKSEFLSALLVHVEAIEGIAELLRPSDEAASGVQALREAVNANAEFERRVHDVATMLLAARRSSPVIRRPPCVNSSRRPRRKSGRPRSRDPRAAGDRSATPHAGRGAGPVALERLRTCRRASRT